MNLKKGVFGLLAGTLSIVIIASVVLSFVVSDQYKQTALQREIDVNANFIMTQAKLHLTPDDFTPINFEQKEQVFSKFFQGVDTSEIIRIKVWSTDGTVLYSNDKTIVGQQFLDNEELHESVEGEIAAEIKPPEKAENISEKGYAQLMEIYVPIQDSDGSVFGVIETYVSLDRVNIDTANANSAIYTVMLFGSGAVILGILLVFIQLQKNAIGPILKIQNATKQISDGNLDVTLNTKAYDEIKTLSNNVETMAQHLKKQRNDLIKVEKLSTIGELSARLSHDLRNPLHVIRNTLKLIKEDLNDKMNDTIRSDFERIDKSIRRMSHQIESVLDYASVKSLTVSKCSLGDVIKSTLTKLAKPDGVQIHVSGNDVSLECDSTKIEVVLENVIMNGIQAVGTEGKIEIRMSEDAENAVLEIEDSGPGIPDDILPKIFEPLFTTRQQGTGLGLATCKSIISQHGGTIEVRTKPTVFMIKIPKKAKMSNRKKDIEVIAS
jgi:signal transduction histidine kinase